MAVFRISKTSNYTVMSNFHFKEKRMSLKAKGLLSLMLSLPDNWDYSLNGLNLICKENETSIRATLKELEQYGYLERIRRQNAKGQFEYDYNIYEKPYIEKPHTENLHTDKPHTENHTQLNTNILNTNELNTKKSTRFIKPTLEEIENYIIEKQLNVNAKQFYEYFETGNWVDSKGNKVKSWKQKLLTWNNHTKPEASNVISNRFFDPNDQYSNIEEFIR